MVNTILTRPMPQVRKEGPVARAVLASYLPARRAARVDPTVALRAE